MVIRHRGKYNSLLVSAYLAMNGRAWHSLLGVSGLRKKVCRI